MSIIVFPGCDIVYRFRGESGFIAILELPVRWKVCTDLAFAPAHASVRVIISAYFFMDTNLVYVCIIVRNRERHLPLRSPVGCRMHHGLIECHITGLGEALITVLNTHCVGASEHNLISLSFRSQVSVQIKLSILQFIRFRLLIFVMIIVNAADCCLN
jgi:hypothetical protein